MKPLHYAYQIIIRLQCLIQYIPLDRVSRLLWSYQVSVLSPTDLLCLTMLLSPDCVEEQERLLDPSTDTILRVMMLKRGGDAYLAGGFIINNHIHHHVRAYPLLATRLNIYSKVTAIVSVDNIS
jgi:hypothetical protein